MANELTKGLTHPDYHSRPLDDYDHDMSAAEESDGPDPYDNQVESEMEREARDRA